MDSIYFEITDGQIKVGVTVTETADGALQFDLSVLDDTGHIGDLNGLFFDLSNDGIADSLSVSGVDLTGDNIDANSVTKVDGYNNVNGEVVKEDGKFDIGVQFGTQGIGEDDIQSTSFLLSSDSGALSIADVLDQDFAVRLTSVGEIDGSRNDSVKISGTSDPIEDPDPEPPTGPTNIAEANSMTVSNNEGFSDFADFTDPLDNFQFSVLENDTTSEGDPYTGVVTSGNGQDLTPGLILEGSNGGLMILNADGTVDFSANGQFDYLSGEDTALTTFEYGIEGGDSATIDVTVYAFDPDGDGGGGIGVF